MLFVTGDNYPHHERSANIPQIPAEVIKAHRNQAPDFETVFRSMQQTHPDVALELMLATERFAARDTKLKRAFAEGALFYMGYLKAEKKSINLTSYLNNPLATVMSTTKIPNF